MQQSFEYCALRYLLLWEQKERGIHARMSHDPSPEDLRKALHHFRVSRGFKGLDEGNNADLVLSALRGVGTGQSLLPEDRVESLATQFSEDFGRSNLSAATKLLWLTYRRPYLIYDARAAAALSKELGYEFTKRSYAEYASAWRAAYKRHKTEVVAAAEQLPNLQPFFSAWHDSPASIEKLIRKPWFLERIFDVYLWELGAPQKAPPEA
jgi:hypothetical protein